MRLKELFWLTGCIHEESNIDKTVEMRGRKIEKYCGLNAVFCKCFNPSGEFCYRIMICFRELFQGLFFGRCIWRRFCFGTARGANATGLNSGFSNSSLFNVFFQFLQSGL